MKQKKAHCILLAALFVAGCGTADLPENYSNVESRLYLGKGENQPLIVGLGGSEGGNVLIRMRKVFGFQSGDRQLRHFCGWPHLIFFSRD